MAVDKPQGTAEEILASLGDATDKFHVSHNQVLVAIFMRGDKIGSIYVPDKTAQEDQWQGKVGLVLKKGPLAFKNDLRNDFADQTVEPGQWVVYRTSDGFPIDINKVHCRLIEDIHIKGRVDAPEIVW